MEDKIRLNAELVVAEMKKISGIEFGYNPESVDWLDGFVERQRLRPDISQNLVGGLVSTLGSYLGESLIRCYGGRWHDDDGQWCVCFNEGNCVFPFNKIRKQFENGSGDSIGSFFRSIPLIFASHIEIEASSHRPEK